MGVLTEQWNLIALYFKHFGTRGGKIVHESMQISLTIADADAGKVRHGKHGKEIKNALGISNRILQIEPGRSTAVITGTKTSPKYAIVQAIQI
jgi:hypothetical protein